ncbi:MAG: hypothetical protein INR65_01515 [Gluconacetobacter diazotrophicus]|nr:hypothetical protein [Gluconacetobacter diazotrophicus]
MDYQFKWTDGAGFVGSLIIVGLYLGSVSGRMRTDGLRYASLNLFGSALLIVSLCFNFNPPSFVIELFWSAVSLYGVVRGLRRR